MAATLDGNDKPKFTKALLQKFDLLTQRISSRDQLTRIEARLECKKFVEEHGQEVCDSMFAELQKRDQKKRRK